MSREPLTDDRPRENVAFDASSSIGPTWPKWLDGLAWCYATGCGVGLSPKAPGTVASLFGPVLVWAWQSLQRPTWEGIALTLSSVIVGVVASDRVAARQHCKDPGVVVCDELVAFAIVFVGTTVTWRTGLIGFLWFRIFDIAKPWPISRLEHLPGGWGIMADDLLAGAFAAAALQGTLWLLEVLG